MRQHEHGQIIGVGVGDIEMLAINIHSGGETSLIDTLTSSSGMDCVPRPGAMESKPSPGIGVCGTRGAVREACWGSCAGAEEIDMERAR